MFHNKQALIGLYSGSTSSDVVATQLINFSVQTASGNIFVDWGDSTSEFINSNTPVNRMFNCGGASVPGGFWDSVTPCRPA
jgi:hypothetical protein